jgi:hypothetical protein
MKVLRRNAQFPCIFMAALMLMLSIPCQSVLAALIETETVLDLARSQEARDQLKQFLAREDVQAALITQGVDPMEAEARVESLTDSEVLQILGQIEQLPAGGGVIGLAIGVLIIVLLIVVILRLV